MLTKPRFVYFAYTLITCEMGSEGESGWDGYCICRGNTINEVIDDYSRQVGQIIHDVRIVKEGTSIPLKFHDVCIVEEGISMPLKFYVKGYFDTYFIRLKESVYGHAKEIDISFPYQKHNDGNAYGYKTFTRNMCIYLKFARIKVGKTELYLLPEETSDRIRNSDNFYTVVEDFTNQTNDGILLCEFDLDLYNYGSIVVNGENFLTIGIIPCDMKIDKSIEIVTDIAYIEQLHIVKLKDLNEKGLIEIPSYEDEVK